MTKKLNMNYEGEEMNYEGEEIIISDSSDEYGCSWDDFTEEEQSRMGEIMFEYLMNPEIMGDMAFTEEDLRNIEFY